MNSYRPATAVLLTAVALGGALVGLAAPVGAEQAAQEPQTWKAIQGYLDRSFAEKGEIAVATRVQRALAFATEAREAKGKSVDEILRNAEYYLHGLYAAAASDREHQVLTVGAPVYDMFKYIAHGLKDAGLPWLEKAMRTDEQTPTSPPGGWEWAWKGLKAGSKVDGTKEQGPKNSCGLELRVP